MILLVDDKKENLFSLKALLQSNGYQTDLALSGEEALKKVLKTEYALIILDVQMPGMDGYEVAETINGYSKTRNIPIIFLSAVNIDKRFITQGYASGGVDYVTKPFDPDLMLLKIKTFSRLHEQTRELKLIGETLKAEIESRKEAQKALEVMNVQLEDKVDERTKELLEINKELELSNAELQQYASVASHDLQEPLRKIMTFTNLIFEKHLNNSTESAYYLKKIISSTERMRSLIHDLLNYSKLSGDSSFTQTDLNEVLNGTLGDLELTIKEKNATVIVEELPSLEVIPGQMRQMFQNIISNALKFSKKDAPPVIKIWSEVVKESSMNNLKYDHASNLRIYISDNGIGFDPKYAGKIFELFQRLHRRADYEGTGIGLSIVKKIIDKHNGTIAAMSKEGEGTTFVITLPEKQHSFILTQAQQA